MAVRKLEVLITGNARGGQKALTDLEKTAGRSGKTTGKHLDGIRDSLLGIGIAAGGAFAFNEWNDAQKIGAQTEAMLKSTGGAANTTATEIGDLSEALSEKAGIDDELIQQGANLIGTFTKIQNAGEGADAIFDRATETALDLSVALGTDMTSASMMLGKALNDPLKGLTTLGRAGVQFTADQKEQIKALVETGDVLGAQKIILQELETQVGGSAEAQATAYDKAKVSAGNLAETVGGLLAPAIEGASGAAATGADWFSGLDTTTQTLTAVVGVGGLAWLKYGDQLSEAMGTVRSVPGALGGSVSSFGKMNTAIAGAAAGLTAFAVTTEVLERLSATGTDLVDLAKDMEQLGKGTADTEDVFNTMGTSAESLADDFKTVGDGTRDYGDVAEDTAKAVGKIILGGGLVGGLWVAKDGAAQREAVSQVKEFDKTLADMVASGKTEEAKVAFDQITQALLDQGLTYTEITPLLPEYYDEMDRAKREAKGLEGGIIGVAGAALDQADASGEAEHKTQAHADAMSHFTQEAGDAEAALRGYYDELFGRLTSTVDVERNLDDYANGLFANTTTLDEKTEAGRRNLEAMEALGQSIVDTAWNLSQTDGVEAGRQAMEEYRLRLIATWQQAGYTEDEILVMQTTMGLTPKDIDTKFNTDAPVAKQKTFDLQAAMTGLDGTTASVNVQSNIDDQTTKARGFKDALDDIIGLSLGAGIDLSTSGNLRGGGFGEAPPPGKAKGGPVRRGSIPAFHDGGIVPGPVGSDQLILAQGGERVSSLSEMRSGGGGGNVYLTVYVQGNVRPDRDLIDGIVTAVNQGTRMSGRSPFTTTMSSVSR